MKRVVFTLFALFGIFSKSTYLLAQKFENQEIRGLLISADVIDEDSQCSYYAYELLTSKMMDPFEHCGIFRIGAHVSESCEHLLLINGKTKVFIDYHKNNFYQALNIVFSFFEDSAFTDTEKLSYIRKIMEVYHRNEHVVPW